MLRIYLEIGDDKERTEIHEWLDNFLEAKYVLVEGLSYTHIYIKEIRRLFDWVEVKRFKKRNPRCVIVPIVHECLAHSSPIAMELELPYLLIKPVQKNKFMRAAKKLQAIFDAHTVEPVSYAELSTELAQTRSPFYKAFLRRLVRGELTNENEFFEARPHVQMRSLPNTVLLLQGFLLHEKQMTVNLCSKIIERKLDELLSPLTDVSFLYFNTYLLVLIQVPSPYVSFKYWPAGVHALTLAIEQLKQKQIYVYLGIGKTFEKPFDLHQSYLQARKARKKPPVDCIHVRYFEDLASHPSIIEAIDLIEKTCHEPINIQHIARHAGFSSTHFGRLFKKETGRNFPEYVAYTRLIQSLKGLRRTNHTLEQISADYGFNTPNYYSGTFKKYVTLSPSEYRQTKEIFFK
jgi:two-component system, response regulator YesN